MHQWLADVTHHLLNGTLTAEWANTQNFCKDLKAACGVKITLVFNFPCENEELPEDHFPLAFVLSSVSANEFQMAPSEFSPLNSVL